MPGAGPGCSRWTATAARANVNDNQFAGRSKDFVVVYASLRGTGCSGGTFDLFSEQGARDGYDVIENWIVKQPWSDGRVGITGHSYSGLTGFLVAEEAPPHVNAVAVSGLIDDFYRGIIYSGGIPNAGFPLAWGGAARPASELQGDGQAQLTDAHCRANFLEHQAGDYVAPPTLFVDIYGQTQATPDSWAMQRSLINRVKAIDVPTQIGQTYQDEQTSRSSRSATSSAPATSSFCSCTRRRPTTRSRSAPTRPSRRRQSCRCSAERACCCPSCPACPPPGTRRRAALGSPASCA